MAYNKVLFPDKTVAIDLTKDTVDANKLAIGATAHDRYGNTIVGNAIIGTRPEDLQENKNVSPTNETQIITPDYTYVGLKQVTVNPVDSKSIICTENKTYLPLNNQFFNEVIVNVEKGVFPSGTLNITENGEYNVINYSDTIVNVPEPSGIKNITTNGIFDIKNYSEVNVAVETEQEILLENKIITENGIYNPSVGYVGFNEVSVNVKPKLQDKTVNTNGEVIADSGYDGLNKVFVSVQPKLQDKTVSTNGKITADEGYDGLKEVIVLIPEVVLSDNLTIGLKLEEQVVNAVDYNCDGFAKVTVNGVQQYLEDATFEPKTTYENYFPTRDLGYLGFNSITINPVTASIDKNIKPENIKEGITILNVTGSYAPPVTAEDLTAITLIQKYALKGYNYINSNGVLVSGEMPFYNGSYKEID